MDTGALYSGTKRLGLEADHSISAEVINVWSYASTPPCIFMVLCLPLLQILNLKEEIA
jgi:hypothetical protein